MPFKLEKSGNGYFVVDNDGKRFSEKPLPKEKATAQMRALYANVPDADKEEKDVSSVPSAVMTNGVGGLFTGTTIGGVQKKLAKIAKKEKEIDYTPPQEVMDTVRYGFTLKENNIGTGTGAANVRAESLILGERQEPGTIYRMSVYFDDNRATKDDDRVTWLLMGGDAADKWTHEIVSTVKEIRRTKEILFPEFVDEHSPLLDDATLPVEFDYLEDDEPYIEIDDLAEVAPLEDEFDAEEIEDEFSISENEGVNHTGVMVAFFVPPENADELSGCVPSPISSSDMHITLAYLGEVDDENLDKSEIISAIGGFVNNSHCVSGKTNGFGRFHGKDGEMDAVYANFDAPDLPEFRQRLVWHLSEKGIEYSKDHGFVPHITLSYIGIDDETPDVHIPDMNIKFNTLYLAWGDERIPLKLPHKVMYSVKEFVKNLIGYKSKKMKREKDGTHPISHYLAVEDPERVSTWHLPVYTVDGELDHRRMGAAWAALHEGYRGNKYSGPKKGDAIAKLVKLYEQEGMPIPGQEDVEKKEIFKTIKEMKDDGSDMVVYKQANGKYRWITISSNGFRDRDGEIVSTKALENDCARADKEKDYGTLRWWHVPGLDIGDCDFNMVHGHMLIESGTFRDSEIGLRVKEEQKDLEISIGFTHPSSEPDKDGVFNQIRRFERSLVPKGRVSNRFTSLIAFDA